VRLRETRDGVYGLLRLKWEVHCFLLRSQIIDNIFTQDTFRGREKDFVCMSDNIHIHMFVRWYMCVWVRTGCYSELHFKLYFDWPLNSTSYILLLTQTCLTKDPIEWTKDFLWTAYISVKCDYKVQKTDRFAGRKCESYYSIFF